MQEYLASHLKAMVWQLRNCLPLQHQANNGIHVDFSLTVWWLLAGHGWFMQCSNCNGHYQGHIGDIEHFPVVRLSRFLYYGSIEIRISLVGYLNWKPSFSFCRNQNVPVVDCSFQIFFRFICTSIIGWNHSESQHLQVHKSYRKINGLPSSSYPKKFLLNWDVKV